MARTGQGRESTTQALHTGDQYKNSLIPAHTHTQSGDEHGLHFLTASPVAEPCTAMSIAKDAASHRSRKSQFLESTW